MENDPRRRHYALTAKGERELGCETARWRALVKALEARGLGERAQ